MFCHGQQEDQRQLRRTTASRVSRELSLPYACFDISSDIYCIFMRYHNCCCHWCQMSYHIRKTKCCWQRLKSSHRTRCVCTQTLWYLNNLPTTTFAKLPGNAVALPSPLAHTSNNTTQDMSCFLGLHLANSNETETRSRQSRLPQPQQFVARTHLVNILQNVKPVWTS